MLLRFLGFASAGVSVLAGVVLGFAGVMLRTSPGRGILLRNAVVFLNRRVDGTASIAAADGSFTSGLVLREVILVDREGNTLADIPSIGLRYRLRDLIGGRVVLGQVRMRGPTFNLIEADDGTLNLLNFLRLGRSGSGNRRSLIAFRDVEITDGTLLIHTRFGEGDSTVGDRVTVGGRVRRLRRIDHLNARLPYLRLASPFEDEEAIRVDIERLSARISDPELDVRGVRGTAEFLGDSVNLELSEVVLPDSRVRLRGAVTWHTGPLLYNLEMAASRISSTDLPKGMVPFPDGLAGSGRFTVESRGADTLRVYGESVALRGRSGGGTLTGSFGFTFGPDQFWSSDGTEMEMENFDISYFRLILDTLPVLGRLTGSVRADGPHHDLTASLEWSFADSLVASWPVSRLNGEGGLRLGVPEGFTFNDFEVYQSDLSLETIRRLVPKLNLTGRIKGSGRLNGVWTRPTLRGTLVHDDAPLPPSSVTGVIALDTERDLLGVWADVSLDSLNFEGLRSTYPDTPLRGGYVGRLAIGGYLDSLVVDADITGPRGRVVGSGIVVLTEQLVGVMNLNVAVEGLEPQLAGRSLPPSRLNGGAQGTLLFHEIGSPFADLQVRLDSSLVLGFELDSLTASVGTADSLWLVDSLLAWSRDARVRVFGAFGTRYPKLGLITVEAESDSLGSAQEFFRWVVEAVGRGRSHFVTGGALAAEIQLEGALDRFEVRGHASLDNLAYGNQYVDGVLIDGFWQIGGVGELSVTGALDTLVLGDHSFSGLYLALAGTKDSLHWQTHSRIGSAAALNAAGVFRSAPDSATISFDSLVIRVPSDVWLLRGDYPITLTDGGLVLTEFKLSGSHTATEIEIQGRVRPYGVTSLTALVRDLDIADVIALVQRRPELAGGVLNGTVLVRNTLADPEFDLSFAVRNARWRDVEFPHLDVRIQYAAQRLTGDVGLWRTGRLKSRLSATLPVNLSLQSVDQRLINGDLSIEFFADSLDLTFFGGFSGDVDSVLGRLDSDALVTGSWDDPQLSGNVMVYGASVTLTALGVRHEGVTGFMTLSGDTIIVNALSVDGPSGRARIAGFVHFESLTSPMLDLEIDAVDLRALDVRDFLTLTSEARLKLRGPVFGATLTGKGTVSNGTLYFTDLVEKEIIDLEASEFAGIVDIALIRREGLGEGFSRRFLDSLRIDSLELDMGSEMWLRSSEANILLTGQVLVSKIGDQYRLDGTLNTPRGTYRLPLPLEVTREFTVTRGEVRYVGTPDAELDIDAFHQLRTSEGDNITVFVNVGGTLYVPELRLSSDVRPPISDTEIISYLLWGAPSAQLDRVSSDIVGLFTRELERYLISDVGAPFDYLRIRLGEAERFEGTEIAVGQQLLGSRLFLTGTSILCPNDRAQMLNWGASMEFRFSRNWKFSASRDPVRDCSDPRSQSSTLGYQLGVDLVWEKSY